MIEALGSLWSFIDLPVYLTLLLFAPIMAGASMVYFERRIAGFIQERVGPDRVGPQGILQPFADVVKLVLKEDITPTASTRFFHALAPTIMVVVALSMIALIPFGRLADGTPVVVADVSVGMLLVLAMTSLSVYGITLAGWSSNSKYSLLGGLRSSAQMVSYELGMGAAVVSVILLTAATLAGLGKDYPALSLAGIVEAQSAAWGLGWNVWRNPVGFVLFVVCAFAETNRAPFDLPEAEQELVGGYHTEYSGMKFGMFFLAEYVNLFNASLLIATLFLGGYLVPFEPLVAPWLYDAGLGWLLVVLQFGSLLVKTLLMCFVFIWVRWTLPRFKYTQLMTLGWKYLLPIGVANVLVIALGVALWQVVFG